MPAVEFRVGACSADEVLAEFERLKDHFEELSGTTKLLIERILKVEGLAIQSVQARVKSKRKIESKYKKPTKDYKALSDLADIVGLRIITYYSDQVDRIAEIIGSEFAECGPREDKRIGDDPASFGYSAIHLDCAYRSQRAEITEYKHFANARFEIQITTVLGHAWAEMQHPWYDEFDSPTEEVRRFHRLAAVLELAEQEFLEVRKKKDQRERVASVRVAAKAPETPVTAESLRAFIDQHDSEIAALDGLVATLLFGGAVMKRIPDTGPLDKVVVGAGISTIQRLEDKLLACRDALVEFMKKSTPIWHTCARMDPKSYGSGISILHIAYLLAAASGEDRLRAVYEQAGLKFLPKFDMNAYLDAAKEVATEFQLI